MSDEPTPAATPSPTAEGPGEQDWAALAAGAEQKAATLGKGATVTACSPGRSGKQRRHLRGLGHSLKPLVFVGQNGLTGAVANACDAALDQHELVKVKLSDAAPCEREAAALFLHESIGAETVQIVGRTLLCYRAHPKRPRISLPAQEP